MSKDLMNGDQRLTRGLSLVHATGPTATEQSEAAPAAGGAKAPRDEVVVVIEPRVLIRECVAWCLEEADWHYVVVPFDSIDDWLAWRNAGPLQSEVLVLLSVSKWPQTDEALHQAMAALAHDEHPVPIVLISDTDEIDSVFKALNDGVKGYIPMNTGLKVTIEALRLVRAGGVFVPASSLLSYRHASRPNASALQPNSIETPFTARQLAVLEALRKGKANKVIAYELNMKESTVKVHVRSIMRKLGARNRTEVAVRTL